MIRDNDAATPSLDDEEGSIVDAIFAVTDDDRELAVSGGDPLKSALQALLARRMRDLLDDDRENSKAA